MPETRLLITPWGTTSNGVIPGSPTHAERVLANSITKVWPFQNVVMNQIKRKVIDFQLRHEWPIRTVNARNSTARPWAMNISELTPSTSEPFLLNNTWSCLRFAVIVTHAMQQSKKNWIQDQMAEWIDEQMFEMLRGWEFLVTTSEYVGASAPNVIPQFGGLGVNAAGTAFLAAAGAKWNGDITDTNSRMSQRNAGGAPWSLARLVNAQLTIRRAGGVAKVAFVGNTNKGIAESFPHSQQQFTQPAEKMSAHSNVDRVRTRFGEIDLLHAVLDDYPQQAVITMDPDAVEFCVPDGLGMQFLPIEPQGDHDQMMAKSMGSIAVKFPHGIDIDVNTAA